MEATTINIITQRGFAHGTAILNFLYSVIKNIGLVRTNSIQTPYTKTRKSSGLRQALKPKKPENKSLSSFLLSWQWDSNPQPADYKSAALPIELCQHF